MTFCIAIERPLMVATCPLRKGACYWQHRQDQRCCYTDKDLEAYEYAERVGAQLPDQDPQILFERLQADVAKELK